MIQTIREKKRRPSHRARIYAALVPLGILAVCIKIGQVNAMRNRRIVGFRSEWAARGKPVTVEEVRAQDVPLYAKFTVTCSSGNAAEGFVTADIQEKLAEGQEVRLPGAAAPCGKVAKVVREMDLTKGMFPVTVEFREPVGAAGAPRIVCAHVKTLPGALVVPNEVLNASGDGYNVWRVRDGKAERTEVKVESRNGFGAVISGGMQSGDTLVLTGRGFLRDGDAVAREAAAPAPADRAEGKR